MFDLCRVRAATDHSRMNKVAENLRALMSGRISENELARKTGVPQPTIHRVLSGKVEDPRDGTLRPLAMYFGVKVEHLRTKEPDYFRALPERSRPTDADTTRAASFASSISESSLAARLEEEMVAAGHDIASLSALTEVPAEQIRSIIEKEAALAELPAVTLFKIAHAVDMPGYQLLTGLREEDVVASAAQSQPVQLSLWKIAFQLVADFLDSEQRSLPPEKQAEATLLAHDLLQEGLPRAKVLRFVRNAVA